MIKARSHSIRDTEHAPEGRRPSQSRDLAMDVVYVGSHTGPLPTERLQDPFLTPHSTSTTCEQDDRRRTWPVSICINKHAPVMTTITDPFLDSEYDEVFEKYLRNSDRQRWSTQTLTLDDDIFDDVSRAEARIRAYGENLLGQLMLRPGMLALETTEVQVYLVEYHGDETRDGAGGVHCLAWELLEAVRVPELPSVQLRVTRISDFVRTPPRGRSPPPPQIARLTPPPSPPHLPLQSSSPPPRSTVRHSSHGAFRVLLVIARDFSRMGVDRDVEPHLAQWPLMSVQKRLRSRMLLEVVRPGSLEELEEHLRVRAALGVHFNLVHFDLHGRIMHDDDGKQVPWLLFAKQHQPSRSHGYQVPQTHLAKAEPVAELLACYRVENVVLNACLSAYNRTGPATNLAHVLLERGVRNVSAMWFYVHSQTVATYLEAFYEELLIGCADFHVAAQRGRDAIRKSPTGRGYQDFFICVNYARDKHVWSSGSGVYSGSGGDSSGSGSDSRKRRKTMRTMVMKMVSSRDSSPSPSVHSLAESTSSTTTTASSKSAKCCMRRVGGAGAGAGEGAGKGATGKCGRGSKGSDHSPTTRLSDPGWLPLGDERPIMRLTLHLLELEYKLMTSRIVYASDLRRDRSDLDATVESMVSMWLATNLVDDVFYYKAKDFAKRGSHASSAATMSPSPPAAHGEHQHQHQHQHQHHHAPPHHRERRTRVSSRGGYLQLFSPRPVRALRQTLHIVRGVDGVVDPGFQADEFRNRRSEERRCRAQEGLQRFAQRLHGEAHSYLLFLGSQDAQWWGTYLQHLNGDWWVHMPWQYTVHGQYMRLPREREPSLGV